MKKGQKREGRKERDIFADIVCMEAAYIHCADLKNCTLKYETYKTRRQPEHRRVSTSSRSVYVWSCDLQRIAFL
jgi:hypothetical protein